MLYAQDLAKRQPLQDEDAGQLLAALKNALPATYSGDGVHAWIPSAAEMEELGYLIHSLCIPGTSDMSSVQVSYVLIYCC